MKLKLLKKSKIFEKYDKILPKKELEDLTLFMERKREIGTKSDKEGINGSEYDT